MGGISRWLTDDPLSEVPRRRTHRSSLSLNEVAKPAAEKPVYKKWWLWTTVGGVAVDSTRSRPRRRPHLALSGDTVLRRLEHDPMRCLFVFGLGLGLVGCSRYRKLPLGGYDVLMDSGFLCGRTHAEIALHGGADRHDPEGG